jgi:peptidoglycan hydrolase CwlO-like protein
MRILLLFKRNIFKCSLLIILCTILTGCTAGYNVHASSESIIGFWYGLWHGLIIPITFIISLFNPSIGIYEVNNNGILYNLGFFIGTIVHLGSSTSALKNNITTLQWNLSAIQYELEARDEEISSLKSRINDLEIQINIIDRDGIE